MCIAIIGGVKGMEREYKEILEKNGCKYKIFNQKMPDFDKKIKNVDGVIIFTNTVSHKLTTNCVALCRKKGILMARTHSSSINKLEKSIETIKKWIEGK
jgi:effector-binding domain-containing protein